MYLQYFGLREFPFSLTPDTAYFFSYGPYAEALNTLLVALRGGEGFIKVTGEVGTGKTLLCRKLLDALEPRFVTAYLPNPQLTPSGLSMALAEELGLELPRNLGRHRLLKAITGRLLELHAAGRPVVLCLDEAQAAPEETLEALRLLTNLETEKRKLLQVVMFGQPELDVRLAKPSLRQLAQRITFAYRLRPLDRRALDGYLVHRLVKAGFTAPGLFRPGAQALLYKSSGGIPRLINILAHKALMVAYGRGDRQVSRAHVRLAVRDTPAAQPCVWYRRKPLLWGGAGMAGAAGLAWAMYASAATLAGFLP